MDRIPRRALAIELLCVALWVGLFYGVLLTPGKMQSGGDAANLFWPIKYLMAESFLLDGVVPLWNPWSYLGAPLAASMQHAVFYPPEWLFYGLLPPHVAMNVSNLAHLLLAGFGAWAWLRLAHRLGPIPSVIAGSAFPCIAWFWGHQEHINQIACAAWLPALATVAWLFLTDRLRPLHFITLYAAFSALQFMTGHPQEAVYSQLFSGLMLLVPLVRTRALRPWLIGKLLPFAAAGALTALLVAVQLVMTLELERHSRRQFRDPLYAISFSMPPDQLLTYLNPHKDGSFRDGYFEHGADGSILPDPAGNPAWNRRAFGEYGLFVGLPLLLLALLAPVLAADRRRLWLFLAAVWLLCVLLALGGNTDPRRLATLTFTEFPDPGWSLHELFLLIFPPAQGLRVPARIMLVGGFLLVTAGAIGMAGLLRYLRDEKSRRAAAVGLAVGVFVSLFVPSLKEKFRYPAPTGIARLVLEQSRRPERSLDQRLFRLTMSDDDSLIRERHRETTFGRGGDPIGWRAAFLQPHMNVIARIPITDGYEEGLVPTARFKDFTYELNRNLRQYQPDPLLLSLMGVSHLLTEVPVDPTLYPPDPSELELLAGKTHRNPIARGAAFSADGLEGLQFERLDGPAWLIGEPRTGINTVAVDFGSADLARWQAAPRLKTSLPSVNRISVRPLNGLPDQALIALGWYPGWVAIGPGGEHIPLEWRCAFLADLPAEARSEGWNLAFRPESYRVGLLLSAIGVAIWMACWRLGRKFRRAGF